MIATKIERTTSKDNYTRLGKYVLGVGEKAPVPGMEGLAAYITDQANGGERAVAPRITNCDGATLRQAIHEIEATQAANTRSKSDKSYHLVISFPEGERPPLETLREIEDALCAAIGLGDHQRISAIHDDTNNLHIHVAINKVHPVTLRNVEPYYDKQKLMAACVELEKKHGLIRTNHGVEAERSNEREQSATGDRSEKMEAHAGRESLASWITENAKEDLVAAAKEAPSWDALHAAFTKHGLELRQKGAGFVVGVPGTGAWVKASSIDRSISAKALTGRLGEYQTPPRSRGRPGPGKTYTGAPKHSGAMTKALFARYQKERSQAELARSEAVAGVNQAHAEYAIRLREHYRLQRDEVRSRYELRGHLARQAIEALEDARKKAYAERRKLAQEARAQARAAFPLPTWQKFVEREAARGDEAALGVLRSRTVQRGGLGADILTAADVSEARNVVYQHLSPSAQKNGDMVYKIADGGRVTDRASEVRADTMSEGAAFLALSLASDRFAGQALVIDGSDAFKAAVIEAAAIRGMDVRFSDPDMERARQNLTDRMAQDRADNAVPPPTGAQAYVNGRNADSLRIGDIPPHRLWTPADAGPMEYAGRRRFPDGTEAVLLRDERGIAVMPVTWRQAAKASRWTVGQLVVTDDRGRFADPARGASKGKEGPSRE